MYVCIYIYIYLHIYIYIYIYVYRSPPAGATADWARGMCIYSKVGKRAQEHTSTRAHSQQCDHLTAPHRAPQPAGITRVQYAWAASRHCGI